MVLENKLYAIGENIKINNSYDNDGGIDNGITEELSRSVNILRFDSDPNIFLDGVPKYEAIVYKIFGIKINQRFKKERALTGELENEDH